MWNMAAHSVPEGNICGKWMEMRHGLTRTADGGNTWSTEANGKQWKLSSKAFKEDDSQKGENISSWNIIPKTVIVAGIVIGGKNL